MSDTAFRILVVEDDERIRSLLSEALARWEFEVVHPDGFARVAEETLRLEPHLAILDVNLPVLDGFEWCRRIRAFSRIPVIMISARDSGPDTLMGLSSGADDYVAKPFSVEVLVAKVRALLRRSYDYAVEEPTRLLRGDLILDLAKAVVARGAAKVELSKNELLILSSLMRAQGGVVSRDELATALWRDEVFVDDNTLTVNMSRLRQKLAELGAVEAVKTIKGRGYILP